MRVPVVLLSFVLAIPAVARDPDVPPHDGWLPLPTLVSDETKPQEPDTIMFASIPGKCSTLKVAGCKGIAIDPQDNVWIVFGGSISEYAAGSSGLAQPIRVISGNLTGLTNATSIAFKR